ncbi:MAG: VOC family protein [Thermoleophilia bacterium]|nr:VOC family protein [Thermoleophilia bacterium]
MSEQRAQTLEMGAVTLSVADLPRSIAYYEDTIGLLLRARAVGSAELGTERRSLLRLVERPGGPAAPGTPGLFHFALLVPNRQDLGRALAHFIEERVPLQGVADHIASEALYLSDPDDHGIEIYRDRPQAEWQYEDGKLRMATLPLDAQGVLEAGDPTQTSHELAPQTRMGHVHLRVSTLPPAARFFEQAIGLEIATTMPGALFLASDGYHHHIGANVWQSRNRSARPAEGLGLERFEIIIPADNDRAAIAGRARELGYAVVESERGPTLTGMDNILCELVAA